MSRTTSIYSILCIRILSIVPVPVYRYILLSTVLRSTSTGTGTVVLYSEFCLYEYYGYRYLHNGTAIHVGVE
eukprot:COSAG05_NODE_696_length_7879_cov_9.218895_6_plen_72_part_00